MPTAKSTSKKKVVKVAKATKTKTSTKKKPVAKKTVTKKAVKKATKKTVAKKPSSKTTPKPFNKKDIATFSRQPLGHLLVEKNLREGGFRGGVSSDKNVLEKYSTDESVFSIKPQIVIQPKSAKDVERAVSLIAQMTEKFPSLSLTPRAAGSGLSGGSLTDSIVIDISTHLKHIGEPTKTKDGITITVDSGAMWKDVEKVLAKEGVYIPSYPASKDLCTIGGAVGNNAAGPDSLRYGHTAEFVKSLEVVLHDGNTYTVEPITYKEFKTLTKKKNAYAQILNDTLELITKNEKVIKSAEPKTKKNSAGYSLWNVLDVSVAQFKKGKGKMDLTRIISGSQGTIGIVTKITLKTEPINNQTELIAVPVFDLADASKVIKTALEFNPINVELFDGFTFDLALKNPDFFRDRLGKMEYYKVLLSMYTTYHVRYKRKLPEFILLITLSNEDKKAQNSNRVVTKIRENGGKKARLVSNPTEQEMFWQIRRASYTLSKFQDKSKRPAAFLEDITIPPEKLAKFFVAIKKLLKKYGVTAAVHGHGGNGHLHFYPLIDFTKRTAGTLVTKMADEFFETATHMGGNICGEHNDGIIRTPHLSKMFKKNEIALFEKIEHIFDPEDIFNPGKKVNPRFDIKDNIRKTN